MAKLDVAENIRLVIWDLDETFWDGTLTEGGIVYRDDHHQLVIDLAERGIMSTICSKNNFDEIETLLKERGLWDYFILPSIDWTPKGPRIQAMLETIGLRAASCLFLDDNPMNLAQAQHVNPGLNVALPEVIPEIRDAPEFKGKDDRALSRLKQYKITERKTEAAKVKGSDTVSFLRSSNVKVYLDYDVDKNIDRAVELVNRTNQLNFTKKRLPEDAAAARAELRETLAHNTVDAALIRVRDDYGDYGFVGFYMRRRINNKRHLEHFCFSCRTLNMYIEHWVYDFLGRPKLDVVGEVLSDVHNSEVQVDWITPANIEDLDAATDRPVLHFDQIFARGGCDLASLLHYFTLHADSIIEEYNEPRNGQPFRRDHSAFLMPALEGGLTDAQLAAAAKLGYRPEEFTSALPDLPAANRLYFLSFWADSDIPLYRHRDSGLRVPYWLLGSQTKDLTADADLRARVARTDAHKARLEVLSREFEHEGILPQDQMEARYASVLDGLPDGAPVVMVLANETGPTGGHHRGHARLNQALRAIAADRPNIVLLDPADHIASPEDLLDLNHFKRDVYHRMYRDLLDKLEAVPA